MPTTVRLWLLGPAALAVACVVPRSVGKGAGAEETGGGGGSGGQLPTSDTADPTGPSNPTSAGSASAEGTDASGGTSRPGTTTTGLASTGGGFACDDVSKNHYCFEEVDCAGLEPACGSLMSPFDVDGCPRQPCVSAAGDLEACAANEVCFKPMDYGGCYSEDFFCEETGDGCDCFADLSCGAGYCVPMNVAPPANCNAMPEAEACIDAGCSLYEPAHRIMGTGDECMCLQLLGDGVCLYFPEGPSSSVDAPAPYFRYVNGNPQVFMFNQAFDENPLGWRRCSAAEDAPAACGCFGDFTPCPFG